MTCTREVDAVDEFAALQEGSLPVRGRFRLGRHIENSAKCRLQLHVMREYVEKTGQNGPGADHIKALAVLADIDKADTGLWCGRLFFTAEMCSEG
jgi:hypothetical protein